MGNSHICDKYNYQEEVWKYGEQLTNFKGKPLICYLISSKFQNQYVGLQYILQHQQENAQSCEYPMMYQLRQCMNHPNVVGVYMFNKGKSFYKFFDKQIDSKKSIYRVITQYLELRVFDMKFLNSHQALQLLKCATYGVWEIYKHLGGFKITSEMIGIDNKGNVKVWVNSNFAENKLEFQSKQTLGERQMCLQLYKIIEQNIRENQSLPVWNNIKRISTLSELANFLSDLTQCQTNKELLLQLILKQKTFKNIQYDPKPIQKICTLQNIKNVQKYYENKKFKSSKGNLHMNSTDNRNRTENIQCNQINENIIKNHKHLKDKHQNLQNFTQKPLNTPKFNILSARNSCQQSSRYCNNTYLGQQSINLFKQQSKDHTQLFLSIYNQQSVHSKQKSQNFHKKQNLTNERKRLKKNYSTVNFQPLDIPSIQVAQERFKKNTKNYQSQFITYNKDQFLPYKEGENINTIDSPKMKPLELKNQSESYFGSQAKKYDKSSFQSSFGSKGNYPQNNKIYDGRTLKIQRIKQKSSLAQNNRALPIQTKFSFMNNEASSTRHKNNNKIIQQANQKQRPRLEAKKIFTMIKDDFNKLFNYQKKTTENLFESKYEQKQQSLLIQNQEDDNSAKKSAELCINLQFERQKQINNQVHSIEKKSENSSFMNNNSIYLKLSLASYQESRLSNKSELGLQKLYFPKQKKSEILKIHKKQDNQQIQNEQDNRKRSKGMIGSDTYDFIKKSNEKIGNEGKKQTDKHQKRILIQDPTNPVIMSRQSPISSNTDILWQSCNIEIPNSVDILDPDGISYLRTIKQTQRQKDIQSFYVQQSDTLENFKDPLVLAIQSESLKIV